MAESLKGKFPGSRNLDIQQILGLDRFNHVLRYLGVSTESRTRDTSSLGARLQRPLMGHAGQSWSKAEEAYNIWNKLMIEEMSIMSQRLELISRILRLQIHAYRDPAYRVDWEEENKKVDAASQEWKEVAARLEKHGKATRISDGRWRGLDEKHPSKLRQRELSKDRSDSKDYWYERLSELAQRAKGLRLELDKPGETLKCALRDGEWSREGIRKRRRHRPTRFLSVRRNPEVDLYYISFPKYIGEPSLESLSRGF